MMCPECKGIGWYKLDGIENGTCPRCRGSGIVPSYIEESEKESREMNPPISVVDLEMKIENMRQAIEYALSFGVSELPELILRKSLVADVLNEIRVFSATPPDHKSIKALVKMMRTELFVRGVTQKFLSNKYQAGYPVVRESDGSLCYLIAPCDEIPKEYRAIEEAYLELYGRGYTDESKQK